MKKTIAFLLCVSLLLPLLGCQSGEPQLSASQTTVGVTTAPAAEIATEVPTEPITEPTTVPTEPPEPWEGNVMKLFDSKHSSAAFGNSNVTVPAVREIAFLDTLTDMPESAWDVSEAQNGCVMAWFDGSSLYVGAEGGVMAPVSCEHLFYGYTGLKAVNLNGNFHTENTVNMAGMFYQCEELEVLDLSSLDTSRVTDMAEMFYSCGALTVADVSGWDTSNVLDMTRMFNWCRRLTTLDLSDWDTSNVYAMDRMFAVEGILEAVKLKALELGEWEVTSVDTYEGFMLRGFQVNGKPWEELFANVPPADQLPQVPASNVITEPGIPEEGYELTVYRNLPLQLEAKKILKGAHLDTSPAVESILVDDIPILLVTGAVTDSMPIHIYFHAAGQSKEDNLADMLNFVQTVGGYHVSIDTGGWGESQRGKMRGCEAICMQVNDTDKVIAFCSTLAGADLGRITVQGGSMGGCSVLAYLARGSFTPIFGGAMIPTADFVATPFNEPLYAVHGENERDILELSLADAKALVTEYSPLQHAENMMQTTLVVTVGLQDFDGSVSSSLALEARFEELGKENVQFLYADVGHEVPPEDYAVVQETLRKSLEGAPVQNPIPKVTITLGTDAS